MYGWPRSLTAIESDKIWRRDMENRMQNEQAAVQEDTRRPYEKPRLETLGSVAELTLGPGGTRADGNSGRARPIKH
jgi:hypothetical protein